MACDRWCSSMCNWAWKAFSIYTSINIQKTIKLLFCAISLKFGLAINHNDVKFMETSTYYRKGDWKQFKQKSLNFHANYKEILSAGPDKT